jgi:para-aminobenzoate synthetase component 1
MYFSDMIKAGEVRELMNRYGSEKVPFLFAVDFELEMGIFELNPLESKSLLFRVGEVENYSNSQPHSSNDFSDNKLSDNIFFRDNQELLKIITPPDKTEYKKSYDIVMAGLMRGDTYLINLTTLTEITTPLSFEQIIAKTTSPYALCIPEKFVCFSPERFVRIEKGIITTCPMKGTIDATIPGAVDIIMTDYKEICEHNTITDLLRNDIGAVSKRVWVERFRYTDRILTDRAKLFRSAQTSGEKLKTNS